jgi:hypothetical protein
MELKPLIETIVRHGLVGGVICMAAFIFGLHRGWWFMRAHFMEVTRQRDDYKLLNERTEDTTKKILALLEKSEARS